MTPVVAEPSPSVVVMRSLDAASVRNCHWKSNEHLAAALAGHTDLDLLADPAERDAALRVIAESGFVRCRTSWSRRYPGIEDHLALDGTTGRIHHLHLHFALDAGEPHLKSYRLPWVDEVLTSRVMDPEHGVHVTDPALEALLLLSRATMKRTVQDRVARRGLTAHDERELDWLLGRCSPASVVSLAEAHLGPAAGRTIRELIDRRDDAGLAAFARDVRRSLRPSRRYPPPVAKAMGAVRTVTWAVSGVAHRKLGWPVRFARQNPSAGVVVAIVGADGSGKSSTVAAVLRVFRGQVDTIHVYMGSGDGGVSLARRPVAFVQRAVRRRSAGTVDPVSSTGDRLRSISPALVVWAVFIAYEKWRALRRVSLGKRRGMLVVCDRWPQVQFLGHNDGPLLGAWRDHHGWRGVISRAEFAVYGHAAAVGPDLVLRLVVDPMIAHQRRPEHDFEDLKRRTELARVLEFPPSSRVLDVDGSGAQHAVHASAVEAIWEQLWSSSS